MAMEPAAQRAWGAPRGWSLPPRRLADVPTDRYYAIGDLHSALVGSDGSIDWLCLPRFDSAACFSALLGEDRHGHWRISPADGNYRVRRCYRPDTLVLETEFSTDSGAVRVIDCMPPRDQDPVLIRLIEGISGTVSLRMTLAARFEYGSARPRFRQHDDALGIVERALWLPAPVASAAPGSHRRADRQPGDGSAGPGLANSRDAPPGPLVAWRDRPENAGGEAG
jgi:hypothetical protein